MDLRNCDNMELMKQFEDNYFDLAIVDPPYGNNTKADVGTGEYSRGWLKNRKGNWDNRPDENYWKELMRVSKNQIVFGANFFSLPPSRGWICWYKTDEVKGRDFSEFELAYTSFDRPARHFVCKPFIRDGKRIHPTQKPIELYNYILHNYAEKGMKILDTHLGSGTIAVACHYKGFDLTACEIDTDYYNAALKRIKNDTAQVEISFNHSIIRGVAKKSKRRK